MSEAVAIDTARGSVQARFDAAAAIEARSPAVVLMVGGGDGGFEGPAEGLYPTLAEDLGAAGIAALRLDFRIHRFPNDVDEGVHDVLAGVSWLAARGYARIALLGHSFGGAVVIEAGVRADEVVAAATLAAQTAGADHVAMLAPKPLLLIHGRDDRRLPPACSIALAERAGEPCQLLLIEGATHSLRQAREQVRTTLLDWSAEVLS